MKIPHWVDPQSPANRLPARLRPILIGTLTVAEHHGRFYEGNNQATPHGQSVAPRDTWGVTLVVSPETAQHHRRHEQPDGGGFFRAGKNKWAYWGNLRLPILPWGD